MNSNRTEIIINQLFHVKSGDFHAIEELGPGDVPLIACGFTENGFIGYFDIPLNKTYKNAITVAYNGSYPLTTRYHPYRFGAKDDVAVLTPRKPMKDSTLFYIAALLNRMTWRYSYGRKCYREKLQNVSILVPVIASNGEIDIDEQEITRVFPNSFKSYIPEKIPSPKIKPPVIKWESFNITEIFNLDRGDFHSIASLNDGKYMTISRVSDNNGVVGYFDRPKKAKLYERGTITISTVGGDSFVKLDTFMATDNEIVCSAKKKWRLSTLFFMCFMLNQQKWRYSYGRQCYKEKLSKVNIELPINHNGEPNEDIMRVFVEQTDYWQLVKERFQDEPVENSI